MGEQVEALARVEDGRLPHARVKGATRLVTWRLHEDQPPLRPAERSLVQTALEHFQDNRYRLHAYVVMDDHVHLLVTPYGRWRMRRLVRTWRSYTAHELRCRYARRGTLWDRACDDRILRSLSEASAAARYVLAAPDRRWPGVDGYPWRWVEPGFW